MSTTIHKYIRKNSTVKIKKGHSSDLSLYQDVLHVRSQAYNQSPIYQNLLRDSHTEYDSYSDLYCLYLDDEPVGTITATQAAKGKLDCEEYYPGEFINRYREMIGSAIKFGTVKAFDCNEDVRKRIARILIETTWKDQLDMGIRFDIINAHERMVPYYRRLGYLIIADSFFIHPQLGTPSYSMFLPADGSHPSYVQHLFSNLNNPLPLNKVSKYINVWSKIPN